MDDRLIGPRRVADPLEDLTGVQRDLHRLLTLQGRNWNGKQRVNVAKRRFVEQRIG